jgi:hypothetical protein
MVNSRVDWLEQQFVSLMAMFKGFIKKPNQRMEMMERMKKKLDSLLLKKVLDAHKNEVQCPQHLQTVSLQFISSPLENQATKTQRLQTTLLDTNEAPLAMTKSEQIRLPQYVAAQYDVLPPWAIYARNQRLHQHGATSIVKQLKLQIHSPSNHRVHKCHWWRGIIHRVNARLISK